MPELLGLNFQMLLFICFFIYFLSFPSQGSVPLGYSWNLMVVCSPDIRHLQQDLSLVKLWCLKLGISVQIEFSFLLFEVLGSCKTWPVKWGQWSSPYPGVWRSSGATCDLYWRCCCKKDFEVCSQQSAPNNSGDLWLWGKSFCSRAGEMWRDNLGFMWQGAHIEW